ncbi:hypothetical protein I7X12_15320 [Halosimplex litoreum]|uniref:Uncharacterized protein n=1 Tax=Halosimplex litoreum TaxID=1198301 RepID=A0A7T3FWL0_9EURY|nr:hypothetical protein [Halosimplex litoreum]QPV62104.1 hypothetical protein I7X12_15320 [Halosimplex litoreum]
MPVRDNGCDTKSTARQRPSGEMGAEQLSIVLLRTISGGQRWQQILVAISVFGAYRGRRWLVFATLSALVLLACSRFVASAVPSLLALYDDYVTVRDGASDCPCRESDAPTDGGPVPCPGTAESARSTSDDCVVLRVDGAELLRADGPGGRIALDVEED